MKKNLHKFVFIKVNKIHLNFEVPLYFSSLFSHLKMKLKSVHIPSYIMFPLVTFVCVSFAMGF